MVVEVVLEVVVLCRDVGTKQSRDGRRRGGERLNEAEV